MFSTRSTCHRSDGTSQLDECTTPQVQNNYSRETSVHKQHSNWQKRTDRKKKECYTQCLPTRMPCLIRTRIYMQPPCAYRERAEAMQPPLRTTSSPPPPPRRQTTRTAPVLFQSRGSDADCPEWRSGSLCRACAQRRAGEQRHGEDGQYNMLLKANFDLYGKKRNGSGRKRAGKRRVGGFIHLEKWGGRNCVGDGCSGG